MDQIKKIGLVTLSAWIAGVATAHAAPLLITARTALWSDDLDGHEIINGEPPQVPLAGVSVQTLVPWSVPFFPEGSTVAATVMGGSSQNANGGGSQDRLSGDVTFTAKASRNFGLSVGYRYESAEDNSTGAGGAISRVDTSLNSGRIGIVSESSMFGYPGHRLVTAIYGAVGQQKTSSSIPGSVDATTQNIFAGPEVTVGYQGTFRSGIVIDLRYRAALYATNFGAASNAQTQNAIMASIGYQFGGQQRRR